MGCEGGLGGEAGGRLVVRRRPRTKHIPNDWISPRPGSSQKHNQSRSARCAERTHWPNGHPFGPRGRRLKSLDSYQLHPASQLPSPDAGLPNRLSSGVVERADMGSRAVNAKPDSCVVAPHAQAHAHPAACQPSWSQFLIPCSLGNDSSRQISVFHPLPLFHWMREIGASRSGHICTPSHLTQPFHWVQHRCGLHNTDMSLAAKAHHGILPTCLGENLGQIGVDITSISLSSRYSARHTVTALYRRLLRTSVPALLPRHATGQRVHTAYAMYSIMFTDISKRLSKSRAAPDHLQRPEDVAGVGDIETREMASSSYTNTQNLGVILPCPVCQLRYRHLEDSIHMPLLGTEHTNLPCGVLIFNMHEDCSNKHTRPPQLSLVHHDSPTSGTPY